MPDDPKPSDDPKPTDDPKPADPKPNPADDPKPPWGSPDEFQPDRAWKLITDIRADLDKVKTERDTFRTKAQEAEDAKKSKEQLLEEGKTTAEQRATDAESEAARLRVALDKGLTLTQAKRLVGTTKEELEADADELLASFRSDDDGQEPPRRPRERLRPGAAPTTEPEPSDPAELAKQVPRGW